MKKRGFREMSEEEGKTSFLRLQEDVLWHNINRKFIKRIDMSTILNVNETPIFLVEFTNQFPRNRFVCHQDQLMECIKRYNRNGIKSIKRLDPSKGAFKKVAAHHILQLYTWETESYLYLTELSYFK